MRGRCCERERDAEDPGGYLQEESSLSGNAVLNCAGERADHPREPARRGRQTLASAPEALRWTGKRSVHAGSFPPLRPPDNSTPVALH
jgi:hypothetical protein